MKKILISTYVTLLSMGVNAQDFVEVANKSMYNIGNKITSCESNFENLFNNWTIKHIDNVDQTKLLSYKLIETIKDETQVDNYIELLTTLDAPQRKLSIQNQSDSEGVTTKKVTFNVTTYKESYEKNNKNQQYLAELKTEISKIKEHLKRENRVKIGDKVFLVKLKSGKKTYDNYVVCDADNYKVKWDNLFDFAL